MARLPSFADVRASYEDFVLRNAPLVTAVEGIARNVAFFLPGRVVESELAAESVFAALNVLGVYHDAILAPHFPQASAPGSHTALFNRYARAAVGRPGVRHVAFALAGLSAGEVVLELLARRRGDRARWDVVLAIEAIKAGLRLHMFNQTGGRMVLSPPLPVRDYDTSQPEVTVHIGPPNLNDVFGSGAKDPAAVSKFLTSRALTDPSALRPGDLVGVTDGYRKWCEIAFILRPVIYVTLIRQYGVHHALPFSVSLAVDLTALLVSQSVLRGKRKPTVLEKAEYQRRMWLLLWYLLRGPMYDRWTSPRLSSFVGWTKGKMGISILGNIVADYLPAWESVYFHTAASS
ncbi:peroxisome membrane protein [Hyaloraphidium curvatum]|nr:peroxisome membrane protein [Hyaloraphidium curvatum]